MKWMQTNLKHFWCKYKGKKSKVFFYVRSEIKDRVKSLHPSAQPSEVSLLNWTGWWVWEVCLFNTVWQIMCLLSTIWVQKPKDKMTHFQALHVCVRIWLDGLFSLCVGSRYASIRFRGQCRLSQNHHVIFSRIERLVDPVHTPGHVTGIAGDQHQVADWKEESGGPEEEEKD